MFKNKNKNTLKGQGIAILMAFLFFVAYPASAIDTSSIDDEVKDLNRQIIEKRQEIDSISSKQEDLEKQVSAYQQEAASLGAQIGIIDTEITDTQNRISKTEAEISKINLEVESVKLEIKSNEEQIESQKEVLSELLRILYQQGEKTPLEVFLGNDTISQVFDETHYLTTLEEQGKEALDEIERLRKELQWQNIVLDAKKEKAQALQEELKSQKGILEEEKGGKDRLLEATNMEEAKYQELLAQAKAEQDAAEAMVSSLENQVSDIIRKAREDKLFDGWTPTTGTTGVLNWPIMPTRGISAYFYDPAYENIFGVPHYAIDIPTPQGTPIHAPADAIVGRVHDAGYGYSFILLIHNEELSTVYGHISAFAVSEGQFVGAGDVIGYSGGAPGTRGAGWRTTGPHLHFEVRINGAPHDPLQYLPSL